MHLLLLIVVVISLDLLRRLCATATIKVQGCMQRSTEIMQQMSKYESGHVCFWGRKMRSLLNRVIWVYWQPGEAA